MAQVSVGSVESLHEVIDRIERCCDFVSTDIDQLRDLLATKVEEVNAEKRESQRLLQESIEREFRSEKLRESADRGFDQCERRLSRAESALSHCQALGRDDEDNDHDCDDEEDDVTHAEIALTAAAEQLQEAIEEADNAKRSRLIMAERLELVNQITNRIEMFEEGALMKLSHCRAQTEQLSEHGRRRLSQAREVLEGYLACSPAAAGFASWLRWQPMSGSVVNPGDLSRRLNVSSSQVKEMIGYWTDRDPKFRQKLIGYRERLDSCKGPSEKYALQLKVRQNLAGEVAERLVAEAFRPLGEQSTQSRRLVDDSRYTIVDFHLKNLYFPLILGKGERMGAGVGESIAIEVKCGRASYLLQQADHMAFQAKGHLAEAASMTVCSRDIKDLSVEDEEKLRRRLREAGSPMIGMLPRKSEIDRACWETIGGIDLSGEAA